MVQSRTSSVRSQIDVTVRLAVSGAGPDEPFDGLRVPSAVDVRS